MMHIAQPMVKPRLGFAVIVMHVALQSFHHGCHVKHLIVDLKSIAWCADRDRLAVSPHCAA